jgi:hypothetical protein
VTNQPPPPATINMTRTAAATTSGRRLRPVEGGRPDAGSETIQAGDPGGCEVSHGGGSDAGVTIHGGVLVTGGTSSSPEFPNC